MNEERLPALPLTAPEFAALRRSNQIYVDKTDMIGALARCPFRYFLARPPQFGKTLLLSAFEALFRNGLRDFRGLSLENSRQETRSYKVLLLDLALLRPRADLPFSEVRDRYLSAAFSEIGFRRNPDCPNLIIDLSFFLHTEPAGGLVLLIDNCGLPVRLARTEDGKEEVRNALFSFFNLLKSCDSALRMLFITGTEKFDLVTPFGGLNNLIDLNWWPQYGTLLGFTAEEAQRYFEPHLEAAGRSLGLTRSMLLDEVLRHYGGFRFTAAQAEEVIAPHAFLSFLADPAAGFRDYGVKAARESVLNAGY
jgi:hypothetical protein